MIMNEELIIVYVWFELVPVSLDDSECGGSQSIGTGRGILGAVADHGVDLEELVPDGDIIVDLFLSLLSNPGYAI